MSDVDLCNDALDVLGKGNIQSLDESSAAARRCKRKLPKIIRSTQSLHNWQFNEKVQNISQQAEESDQTGYTYKHKIPANYAKMGTVEDPDVADATGSMLDETFSPITGSDTTPTRIKTMGAPKPVQFKVAGGFIHTNFTPIKLTYHEFVTNVEKFPQPYYDMVAGLLAAELAFPLTRDSKITDKAIKDAERLAQIARDNEDQDEYVEEHTGSSMAEARI